jgi:hypothetical protein
MAQREFGEFLGDLVVKTDCRGANQTAPDSSPAIGGIRQRYLPDAGLATT